MLKTTMMIIATMVLVGVSALQVQAATSHDVTLETSDRSAELEGTWQLAHVSQWGHHHECNPSPCRKLKDRHKHGTGSVTE